jgi:hypothetical protein
MVMAAETQMPVGTAVDARLKDPLAGWIFAEVELSFTVANLKRRFEL